MHKILGTSLTANKLLYQLLAHLNPKLYKNTLTRVFMLTLKNTLLPATHATPIRSRFGTAIGSPVLIDSRIVLYTVTGSAISSRFLTSWARLTRLLDPTRAQGCWSTRSDEYRAVHPLPSLCIRICYA